MKNEKQILQKIDEIMSIEPNNYQEQETRSENRYLLEWVLSNGKTDDMGKRREQYDKDMVAVAIDFFIEAFKDERRKSLILFHCRKEIESLKKIMVDFLNKN